MNQILWYGYLHTAGTIHAKRFFDAGDICEARSSPFVFAVYGPFEAKDRKEAMEKLIIHFSGIGE